MLSLLELSNMALLMYVHIWVYSFYCDVSFIRKWKRFNVSSHSYLHGPGKCDSKNFYPSSEIVGSA